MLKMQKFYLFYDRNSGTDIKANMAEVGALNINGKKLEKQNPRNLQNYS